MKIKLTTGKEYDLTNHNDFKCLNMNIANMIRRKQPDRLVHILKQVKFAEKYQGDDAALLRTKAIYTKLTKNDITLAKPIKKIYGHPAPTIINISYRNEQGKRMHGAFYDHYLLRKITGYETQAIVSPESDPKSFKQFIASSMLELAISEDQRGQRVTPNIVTQLSEECGLLFIPGRARDSTDTVRNQFEIEIIKQARLRGQPILAVCAGSWQLLESFGGHTTDVTDHCYASMPYIINDGSVGNNKQMHRIQLTENTMLAGFMRPFTRTTTPTTEQPSEQLTVNSIHWQAADSTRLPNELQASAHAIEDPTIVVHNRAKQIMHPTQNSIEAIESYGAPTIGVQWHPEAYYKKETKLSADDKCHLDLIKAVAKAGDAYVAKRKMMTELLNHHGMFRNNNNDQAHRCATPTTKKSPRR